MKKEEAIVALRELADKLESLEFTEDSEAWFTNPSIYIYGGTKTELRMFARTMRSVKKSASDSSFSLYTPWQNNWRIEMYAQNREQVCKKKVVGTEEVPERTTPAYTKEIVEWECDPILGVD